VQQRVVLPGLWDSADPPRHVGSGSVFARGMPRSMRSALGNVPVAVLAVPQGQVGLTQGHRRRCHTTRWCQQRLRHTLPL
jgi:hypothetical protein